MHRPVDRRLVGYIDSEASPCSDPAALGSVYLEGPPILTVREHTTLRLVYTVGRFGLDDRGYLQVMMRFAGDGGAWQFEDPSARNYVTVRAEPDTCQFRSRFEPYGGERPWFKRWQSQVVGGCLSEGDRVILTLGDTSAGSPGLRLQTFAEAAWELRFLVDVCGTGHFVEISGPSEGSGVLWRPIVPGAPVTWRLVQPTRVRTAEPWFLGIKVEDAYGNPTDRAMRTLRLESDVAIEGLPEQIAVLPGTFAQRIEGLSSARGHCPDHRIGCRNRSAARDIKPDRDLGEQRPHVLGRSARSKRRDGRRRRR